MGFAVDFISCARAALGALDADRVEALVEEFVQLRERSGRVFVLGVGGSAANASHAVNDLRKLCALEAYAPTDNVAELTARTNDDGWANTFRPWLEVSRLSAQDLVCVLSVGGGDSARNISPNLLSALQLCRERETPVVAIVGRAEGAAAQAARVTVLIPTVDVNLLTPLTESFQSLVLHCLVSHPRLKLRATTW